MNPTEPDLNAPLLGPTMTPDELRKYAATTTFHQEGRAILHLFAEYDRAKARLIELMDREARLIEAEQDAGIQQTHLQQYRNENERLRKLVNAKTKAPWE